MGGCPEPLSKPSKTRCKVALPEPEMHFYEQARGGITAEALSRGGSAAGISEKTPTLGSVRLCSVSIKRPPRALRGRPRALPDPSKGVQDPPKTPLDPLLELPLTGHGRIKLAVQQVADRPGKVL